MESRTINEQARDNAKRYRDFFNDFLVEARDDMDFVNGDPWTEEDKIKRWGRPMEVINDAKITLRRTIEDYDQKRSTLKVKSYNTDDKVTAEAFQGHIYHITNDSMGEAIKDIAMSDMLSCGMGFYRWETEYEDNLSFDQKIVMKPCYDPFNIFIDIMNTKEIDYSDGRWGGEVFYYDRENYESNWPDADLRGFPDVDNTYNAFNNDKIAVCRYECVKLVNDTLISVVNPFTQKTLNLYVSDLTEEKYQPLIKYYREYGYDPKEDIFKWLNDTNRVLADRDVERKKIKWHLLNYDEILEEGEIGGEFVPLVPMLGPRYVLNGEVYFDSQIRQTKSPTRLNNFVISNYTEAMSADPIAPYIGDPRKIQNYMGQWADANNKPTMFLPMDPVDLGNGQYDVSPPVRQPKGDVPAGWATLFQFTQESKTRTSGLPDSALGLQGNEVAGAAINARTDNALANRSIFFKKRHFSDQLLGRQWETAIPVYYDSPKEIDVADVSGKTSRAMINEESHDKGEGQYKGKFIDFKNAKLKTYITVGPSYNSQKQETTDKIMGILPFAPERYKDVMFPRFMKNVDIMESEELYEDLMKVAPIEIQDQEEKDAKQLQTENAQLQEQSKQKDQMIEELNKVIMGEEQKVQSQQNIAQLKAQTDLRKEQEKQSAETERERMSNLTDIKEAEIQAQSRKEVELIKQSMTDMSNKMDMLVTAITAKSEA